jgi:hypothetical protein
MTATLAEMSVVVGAAFALVAVLAVLRATGVVWWRGPARSWANAVLDQADQARDWHAGGCGYDVQRVLGERYHVTVRGHQPERLTRHGAERVLARHWRRRGGGR